MPTVSIVKGRGYLAHNDRSLNQIHDRSWNSELSDRNIVYKNNDIKQVYDNLFGESLKEYNQSLVDRNHPERQIKDYYEHISRSKQEKPFYEYVVSFGNMADKNNPEIYQTLQQCLDEYNRSFQERNPNLVVVQQITHRDEKGMDHTHIDVVPVSTNNTRGLDVKNSMRGALREMGWNGKTAFLDWRQNEEQYMAYILKEHGLEFERGSGRDEHLNVREYQSMQREITRQAELKLENMELPEIPEPDIKTNPITKSESVKLSKAEFEQIKQVIHHQQTQITSLEAQKSDLTAKLENSELKLEKVRRLPYSHENEHLKSNLKQIKQENANLTKELELSKKHNSVMDYNLSITKQSLKDSQSEYNKLADQYSNLMEQTREVRSLKQSNQNLTKEVVELRNDKTQLENQVNDSVPKHKYNNVVRENKELREQNRHFKRLSDILIQSVKWLQNLTEKKSALYQIFETIQDVGMSMFSQIINSEVNRNIYLNELPDEICSNLENIPLEFREGTHGKGVYIEGTERMLKECDSFREARDLFDYCDIENQCRSRDYEWER